MPSSNSPTQLLPSLGGTLGFGEVAKVVNFKGNPGNESVCCPTVVLADEPHCQVCGKHYATRHLYDSHLAGSSHKANMAKKIKDGLGGTSDLRGHIFTLLEPVQPRIDDKADDY